MPTWRRVLRGAAARLFPAATTTLASIRSRRLSHRLVRDWGLTEIDDKLVERFGLTVQSGPFAGTKLPAEARAEHLAPYLLGTYESELHPWLEELRSIPFARILDVGAKFGYYALGLARGFPHAESIAFDTDPWARRALRRGARENGLTRLEVRGYLHPRELAGLLRPPTLIVSDCEGYEADLLGAAEPSSLAACWSIIELHEDAAPGVERLLRERFETTHDARASGRTPRTPPPELLAWMTASEASRAVTEARGAQRWLLLVPKAGAHGAKLR